MVSDGPGAPAASPVGSVAPPGPERPEFVPVGEYVTALMGGRYHPGARPANVPVRLQREPDNPHDPNAIRVFNAAGESIGYVARQAAQELAPAIDRGMLRVRAFLPPPPGPRYAKPDAPRDLYLWIERPRNVILFRPLGHRNAWLLPLAPERRDPRRWAPPP